MKLPHHDKVRVDPDKVTEYLLNVTHPEGVGKATFFQSVGFTTSEWGRLAAALQQLARETPITHEMSSPHGEKYIVDGRVATPNGQNVQVRTVWIVEPGRPVPRLVTAYPRELESSR